MSGQIIWVVLCKQVCKVTLDAENVRHFLLKEGVKCHSSSFFFLFFFNLSLDLEFYLIIPTWKWTLPKLSGPWISSFYLPDGCAHYLVFHLFLYLPVFFWLFLHLLIGILTGSVFLDVNFLQPQIAQVPLDRLLFHTDAIETINL